jgi:hypothetical protein
MRVVADADGCMEGMLQVTAGLDLRHRGMPNRGQRGLERGHHESVVVEPRGRSVLDLLEPCLPIALMFSWQVLEAIPDTAERAKPDGAVDSNAPQRTRLTSQWVGVSQRRNRCREPDNLRVVAEACECDRCRPHETSIPGARARVSHEEAGGNPAQLAAVSGASECRPSLIAHVRWSRPIPIEKAFSDLSRVSAAACRLLGDADRQLGVVGPLTGIPTAQSPTLHYCLAGRRRTELVSRTQGVSGGEAEHDAGTPVEVDAFPATHASEPFRDAAGNRQVSFGRRISRIPFLGA